MAERRAIKSTIWDDTWFGRLSAFEMVVWIGLFSKCADDQGRIQDDPALIRSKLFPYQDIALSSIETAMGMFDGHIIRYKKGERLAQLVRWFDNQPMQYAVPSNFPPPDGWVDRYRTNYKGAYIVWNWDGQPNNQLGSLLWDKLSKLERSSSWISYVGRLNPNPNPVPNPQKKDTTSTTPPAPEFPQGSQSQYPIGYQTVCDLAHWPDIPQNQIQAIDANLSTLTLRYSQKQDLIDYCRPFAEEYYKRYPGRTSAGWLDWAVMGNIPEQKKQAAPPPNGHKYEPPQTAAEKRNALLERMRQQEAERARDR